MYIYIYIYIHVYIYIYIYIERERERDIDMPPSFNRDPSGVGLASLRARQKNKTSGTHKRGHFTSLDFEFLSAQFLRGFLVSVNLLRYSWFYILQRGVQWKQGVVICMVLYTILLHNTTPIHCTPRSTAPPFAECPLMGRFTQTNVGPRSFPQNLRKDCAEYM